MINMPGLIDFSKQCLDLSIKKESLILAVLYIAVSFAFIAVLLIALIILIVTGLVLGVVSASTNPYANYSIGFLVLIGIGIIIFLAILMGFSAVFSVFLIEGINQAKKGKIELNKIISRIKQRFFPALIVELFGMLVFVVSLILLALLVVLISLMDLSGLVFLFALLALVFLILLIYLLTYPLFLILPVTAVMEDISGINAITKTISMVKNKYFFNMKFALWFLFLTMVFVGISVVLGFLPVLGGILSMVLGIWFAIYGIAYAFELYGLNTAKSR
ncbi:MAG: hypothetical protein ABIA76_02725 [Candidatus Diapherotrites archaeon]